MKKFINIFAILLAVVSLQSCLKDDDELFDEKAAVRINNSVEEVKNALMSSSNGWHLIYYCGQEYSGAGYNMYMKFNKQYAYISSDYVKPDSVDRCTWTVNKDQGPVLAFDTYCPILHSKSDPSSSAIDGEAGDYEFVVQKITTDSIYVKGKKFGNKMVLTRVPENIVWKDKLAKIQSIKNTLYKKYQSADMQDTITIKRASQQIISSQSLQYTPYYFTEDGIHFMTSLILANGARIDALYYDSTSGTWSYDKTNPLQRIKSPLVEELMEETRWFDSAKMNSKAKNYFQNAFNYSWSIGEEIGEVAMFDISSEDVPNRMLVGIVSGETVIYLGYGYTSLADNRIKFAGTYLYAPDNVDEYWAGGYRNIGDIFNDTFTLSTDNEWEPNVITLTGNLGTSMTITTEKIQYPFGKKQ